MRPNAIMIGVVALLLAILTACGATDQPTPTPTNIREIVPTNTPNPEALDVAVSTPILADLLRNIGGDQVNVYQIIPFDVHPPDYEATDADREAIASADVVLYIGLGHEANLLDVLADADGFAVAEALPPGELERDASGEPYPHVWMYVPLWRDAAEIVRDQLIAVDAAGAEGYTANTDAYLDELADLNVFIREQFIDRVPGRQRIVVTSQPGFEYFRERYLVGGFTASSFLAEGSANDSLREELTEIVVGNNVPTVFTVDGRGDDVLDDIVRRAADRDVTLETDNLFVNTLTPGGTNSTYITMMRTNIARMLNGIFGGETE